MRLKNKVNLLFLTCLFLSPFVLFTGCRSGGGIPQLADLAWWKKDDIRLSSAPTPPAAHFDPTGVESSGESLAGKAPSTNGPPSIDSMKSQLEDTFSANRDSASSTNDSASSDSSQPIRKPYSMGSISKESSEPDNSFSPVAGQLKTQLPDMDRAIESSKSSLADAQKAIADSIRENKNDFAIAARKTADAAKTKADDFSGGWRNDFALPANSGLKTMQDKAQQGMNAANQKLAELQNKTANAVNDFAPPSSFEPSTPKQQSFATASSPTMQGSENRNMFSTNMNDFQNQAQQALAAADRVQVTLPKTTSPIANPQLNAPAAFQQPVAEAQNQVANASNALGQMGNQTQDFANNAVRSANNIAAQGWNQAQATRQSVQNGLSQAQGRLGQNANQFANQVQQQTQSQFNQAGAAAQAIMDSNSANSLNNTANQVRNQITGTANSLQNATNRFQTNPGTSLTPQVQNQSSIAPNNSGLGTTGYPSGPTANSPRLAQAQPLLPQLRSQPPQLGPPSNSLRSRSEGYPNTPIQQQPGAFSSQPMTPTQSPLNQQPQLQPQAPNVQTPAVQQQAPVAPTTQPPQNQPSQDGQYPSTPHSNYAPRNQFSQNGVNDGSFISQAGFESAQNSAGERSSTHQVSNAGGFAPSTPSYPTLGDNSVLIPESISHGQGSFAPGSVSRLIPGSK